MALYWFVLFPILTGVLAYILKDKWMGLLMVVFQLFFIGAGFSLFTTVRNSGQVLWNSVGYPDGLALTLQADALSAFLVLITLVIFLFFIIYSIGQDYFSSQFCFMFLVLQGLMMGLYLSSDLFNMFIFLEVSTVVVSILIMINREKQAVYDGMIYFFVNVIGTAFLLLGIAMLYQTFGLLDWRHLEEAMSLISDPRTLILPFSLMMVTVSLKTAVTPLFSWLPKAHGTPSAPPVVSAVLSGLYIKIGIYMYIRFSEMFAPLIDFSEFFFWVGVATAIVGFLMALGQSDMKLILAYHTVSQVGLIMIGITMGSEIAFWGGVLHIFNHALFKSTLFLTAGIIYEDYGTRNVYHIRGLFQRMPLVATATTLSILGIMGAPFFNASISKYMIAHGTYDPIIQFILNIINLGTILSFIKYGSMLFGKTNRTSRPTTKLPAIVSSLIMGLASLLTGIFAVPTAQYLLAYQVEIDSAAYNQKTMTFIFMMVIGIVLYHTYIKRSRILKSIGHIELTFNGIITAMVGYFILVAFLLTIVL